VVNFFPSRPTATKPPFFRLSQIILRVENLIKELALNYGAP
jgi:hypothetical protein